MILCTHTSDWWKQMIPCAACGARYSDEEADLVAKEADRKFRLFSPTQQAYINRHEEEVQL